MAAQKLPSNAGEQDFGFLLSHNNAESTNVEDITAEGLTFETSTSPPTQPETISTRVASPTGSKLPPPGVASASGMSLLPTTSFDHVSRKFLIGIVGYAIALTLIFLGLLLTGRISLSGNHALESLPDLRPLAPNEFRKVPEGAELPDGHVMRLGESRRFGDVVVTPVRLSRESLQFQGFLSGVIEEKLTTKPVLKLWLKLENVADDYAFPPFDSGLMSTRTPADSRDAEALANTFLTIGIPSGDSVTTRRLNFLHSMVSNFVILGQDSGKVLLPGESLLTFVAENDDANVVQTDDSTNFVWRVQFRKGVNHSSGNGVTTLIDIEFSGADVGAAG